MLPAPIIVLALAIFRNNRVSTAIFLALYLVLTRATALLGLGKSIALAGHQWKRIVQIVVCVVGKYAFLFGAAGCTAGVRAGFDGEPASFG